eukprot:PhM_4_TR2031/c1_g1_i1/m.39496
MRPLSQEPAVRIAGDTTTRVSECTKIAARMLNDAHQLRMAFYLQVECAHRRELERDEAVHRVTVAHRMGARAAKLWNRTLSKAQQQIISSRETSPTETSLSGSITATSLTSGSAVVSVVGVRNRSVFDAVESLESTQRRELQHIELGMRELITTKEIEVREAVEERLARAVFRSDMLGLEVCDVVANVDGSKTTTCVVRDVIFDGPADMCGIMVHDVVLNVSGQPVQAAIDFRAIMEDDTGVECVDPGERITMRVLRNNVPITVRLTAGSCISTVGAMPPDRSDSARSYHSADTTTSNPSSLLRALEGNVSKLAAGGRSYPTLRQRPSITAVTGRGTPQRVVPPMLQKRTTTPTRVGIRASPSTGRVSSSPTLPSALKGTRSASGGGPTSDHAFGSTPQRRVSLPSGSPRGNNITSSPQQKRGAVGTRSPAHVNGRSVSAASPGRAGPVLGSPYRSTSIGAPRPVPYVRGSPTPKQKASFY